MRLKSLPKYKIAQSGHTGSDVQGYETIYILTRLFLYLQTLHERAAKARRAKKKAPIPMKPKIQEPSIGENAYNAIIDL